MLHYNQKAMDSLFTGGQKFRRFCFVLILFRLTTKTIGKIINMIFFAQKNFGGCREFR